MKFHRLSEIYLPESLTDQAKRYQKLQHSYSEKFGPEAVRFFSSPGRTEIGGNHTDHNHGKVIAASINLDSIAAAQINNSDLIRIFSEGFDEAFIVDLASLEKLDTERETTNALIRGMAAKFFQLGYKIGGFNAVITSNVLQGSGLSSSASIESLVGCMMNNLFNDGKISPEEIAKIGQYAENHYFGKPCGLMDQMACSVGNMIAIDFETPEQPAVYPIRFDFSRSGYKLIVLDTGASHADLTEDYAAIPKEMKKVAEFFNKPACREVNEKDFYTSLPELKKIFSHRAILRAIHFFNENKRVDAMVTALENSDFAGFLSLINESGNSSYKYLQNIFTTKSPEEQSVSLALALTENYLKTIQDGACRVHGGGFAGTIQVFIPANQVNSYIDYISPTFGKESARVLNIRPTGVTEVDLLCS